MFSQVLQIYLLALGSFSHHIYLLHVLYYRTFNPSVLNRVHTGTHTHLNLLINLRHTILRVDVEDERSQGLNIAIID